MTPAQIIFAKRFPHLAKTGQAVFPPDTPPPSPPEHKKGPPGPPPPPPPAVIVTPMVRQGRRRGPISKKQYSRKDRRRLNLCILCELPAKYYGEVGGFGVYCPGCSEKYATMQRVRAAAKRAAATLPQPDVCSAPSSATA